MQLTGRVFINVPPVGRLGSKEGAKLGFGNPSRTGVTGDTGVLGFTEKTEIPFVECTIAHHGKVSLKALADITEAQISFDTDTGKSYILGGAWCAKSLELDKGEVSLRFEAMSCEEV